jgi:hypothetical protein
VLFLKTPKLWKMAVIALVSGTFVPELSEAYPDFISYGYSTCITCHYNGHGNGPLNDYGRALFTTEIASRAVFNNKLSEEEIAAKSGFLGSTELPWWIRPGIKYRGLYFINDPGSQASVKKYVTMQADLNVAIQFDQAAKFLVVASGGYSPTPGAQANNKDPKDKNFISREHYIRWQASKPLFLYLGLMDKVFGLRTADHTAFSRSTTALAMNDQSHGLIAQYYGDGWELTGNAFAGNLIQEDAENRQKGFTTMFEYDTAEKNRLGMAVLSSTNESVGRTQLEVHSKLGLEKGNSLLTEIGTVKTTPKQITATNVEKSGGYLLLQGVFLMERGYNVISQIEYANATMSPASPDLTRWSFGLLAFPMPRMEFRATFVNGRSITDTSVANDQWMLQTQLHLSL